MDSATRNGRRVLPCLALLLALGACGERPPTQSQPDTASATAGSRAAQGRVAEVDTATMGAQADPALAAKVDDAKIVAAIKQQFEADPDLGAMALDVDSKDGMVTLSGFVTNSDARVRADRIAKSLRDVRSVNNQLEVKAG
jgi:hyperosmotically inducible periplasmic protein